MIDNSSATEEPKFFKLISTVANKDCVSLSQIQRLQEQKKSSIPAIRPSSRLGDIESRKDALSLSKACESKAARYRIVHQNRKALSNRSDPNDELKVIEIAKEEDLKNVKYVSYFSFDSTTGCLISKKIHVHYLDWMPMRMMKSCAI